MKEILLVGITLLFGVCSSFISFQLGKKNKKYEMLLSNGLPIAEEISRLLNIIEEENKNLIIWFQHNYLEHLSFEQKLEDFHRHTGSLYSDIILDIKNIMEKRHDLKEIVKKAYLYLDYNMLEQINKYLIIGEFQYSEGLLYSDFYEVFWANITNSDNIIIREQYFTDTIKYLKHILPK